MDSAKSTYTATQIHTILSVTYGILHPTFTANNVHLKFKAAPHYRFRIWAEGNQQKVRIFDRFLKLFDESLQSFPMWNTGVVVLMERAVFPIVILFRRIKMNPDYAWRLFLSKTANRSEFLDTCMKLFNEFLLAPTDPINELVVRELFAEEFDRLDNTFRVMRRLGWSWQRKTFRHFSNLSLALKKKIFVHLKLPKVYCTNDYWGALRMDRLNRSYFNDNPNYQFVELRSVNRFFCIMADEQLRCSDNQLNFDARWHVRFQKDNILVSQALADISIPRFQFSLSEFQKVCELSKTTELSVSFGDKMNWDEFLEILRMLVDKVPIKDSEHWPRSASAPDSAHEYKFVIQLGGRVSQKNLTGVANCFKNGFSVLIQNMGNRQEDILAHDTLHGSKRNPRFQQVTFFKGK